MKPSFLGLVLLGLFFVFGCVSPRLIPSTVAQEACVDWTSYLGESHDCSYADGGSLGPDSIRQNITQKVVLEGYPLARKEYGLSLLFFNYDGTYQARKLRFTWYYQERFGEKKYLVYAEDSRGQYTVEDNGAIILNSPSYSTCDSRKSGAETIYAHTQNYPRLQPYRSIKAAETAIVFETKAWLSDFLGAPFWRGKIESRRNYKMPPFPVRADLPLDYTFEGFQARIYYGCLTNGFLGFIPADASKEKIVKEETFHYKKDDNPMGLRPGTSFFVSP